MPEKIFFQCSLPRAGSTVFQNIMNQDERFYASATSGLLELLFAARTNFTQAEEFRAQDPELMKSAFMSFCREAMHGYYNGITDKPFVIDKSRGHATLYDFINGFYPNPKMVCLVRNLEDIIASMEKLFRKNQHLSSPIVNHAAMQGTTTPKRVDIWFNSPPIGLAVERLGEVIRQGIDKKILFIKYESFCLYPELEMKRVYDFFEIEPRQHDLANIEQTTREDDVVYGFPNLHTIRPSLEMLPSDARQVLGKDVCDWMKNTYKWYYDYFGYK
jgi:sulfotransferase